MQNAPALSVDAETVIAAAIRVGRLVLSLEPPQRHGDIIRTADPFMPNADFFDQGFITSRGRYVGRLAAKQIAKAAGQQFTAHAHPGPELFSEDLW